MKEEFKIKKINIMSKSNFTTDSGISVWSLLGIAFIVLKLTGVINWSWWWVTLPFWGGLAFVLIVLMIIGIIYLFNK